MPSEQPPVSDRRNPVAEHHHQELSVTEVHKENFILAACIKLRECLDAINADAREFFQNNVSTDEGAYLVFEDLLVENLQAEVNEVFNLEMEEETDDSEGSDLDSSDFSSDEEDSEEEEEGSEGSGQVGSGDEAMDES